MAVVIFLRFFLHLLLVFSCGVFVYGQEAEQGYGNPPSKIAVIGSGIGGTATAHFLRQHFGPDLQIDVFEKGAVGGRLATVTVNNQNYESGGSVIHSLNLHMQDFVKQLGLKYRRNVAGKTAVFNGKQIILEETDWYLLDLFRLWWRYGFSFIRLQMWVEETMEKFMRIYKYQAHGYAFSSVEQLLHSLGGGTFINMTHHTLSESLLELGVSQRFIDEVIAAVMRANYGQSVSVPAFVGAVSLAGAQTNLWAVEGGNKLVCSGLLKLAKANLIQAKVTTVSLHKTGHLLHGRTMADNFGFVSPKAVDGSPFGLWHCVLSWDIEFVYSALLCSVECCCRDWGAVLCGAPALPRSAPGPGWGPWKYFQG